MCYYFRPLLVTQLEMTKQIFDDIKRFFIELANAESFDEEEAKREYLVRVTILGIVNQAEALKFREFEVEYELTLENLNTLTHITTTHEEF
jgi:hypothetical protein